MEIKTISTIVTIAEVEKCIALLEKDYTDLDVVIEIHTKKSIEREKTSSKPDLSKGEYITILRGSTKTGVYVHTLKKIKSFPFNYKYNKSEYNEHELPFNDLIRYNIIFNLFHELRHAWQYQNNKSEYLKSKSEDPALDLMAYYSSPFEEDADKFEIEQRNKHAKAINEILKIKSSAFPVYQSYQDNLNSLKQ